MAGIPGYLGIMIKEYNNAQLKGIQIVNILDDSPAKYYGLKENDIITSVNGKSVLQKKELTSIIDAHNWGDKVLVNYVRNGNAYSKEIILGYKSNVRTYNVKKFIKPDGEHWIFTDDNTELLVNSDNTPLSISKTDDHGTKDSWTPGTNYSQLEVPQYFLDIDDKMYCVKRIKEDQAKRNCSINDIIFIKELKEDKKEAAVQVELIAEEFAVFPNPSNGQFMLNFTSNEKGTLQISIYDITGRVVKSESIQNFDGKYSMQYNLQNEANGAYLIQVQIGDKMTSKKIIIF